MNWIKITEQLPPDNTLVLVYSPSYGFKLLKRESEIFGSKKDEHGNIIDLGKWTDAFNDQHVSKGITHWMLLTPPEEK